METLKASIKFLRFVASLVGYVLLTVDTYLFVPGSTERRQRQSVTSSRFGRHLLRLFGLRVRYSTESRSNRSSGPRFLVANHLSTLDILILAAQGPVLFITSTDIGAAPVLGLLARLAGVVFVNRKNFFRLPQEIDEVSRLFRHGHSIVLFAEATSTNGEAMLPFKNAFFTVPIRDAAPVHPVCINYLHVDGKRLNRENRDKVLYYGAMDFVSHIWRLCHVQSIDAQCYFLDPFPTRDTFSRKVVSKTLHRAVSRHFIPVARTDPATLSNRCHSDFTYVQ